LEQLPASVELRSMPDTQDQCHEEPESLVYRDEKQSGEEHHENDEPGRDQGLAPRRPSDFVGLGANLLNELEWVRHRQRNTSGGDLRVKKETLRVAEKDLAGQKNQGAEP
jgi:hypothetical protein